MYIAWKLIHEHIEVLRELLAHVEGPVSPDQQKEYDGLLMTLNTTTKKVIGEYI